MENQQWEIIDPKTWKPTNDGDFITGVLVNKREDVGPNKSALYTLDTGKELIGIWGSTVLDNRMDLVQIGQMIRITYKGTEQNKRGQATKIFKVERQKL